jgi:hypothetical protein
MQEYFKLQYRMTNRKLKDFGLHPIIGYLLALIAFVGFSLFLFYKIEFAGYVYVFIAVYLSFNLSETKRNDFLKQCFSVKDYKITRMIENGIIALPFVIFLLYKQYFFTPLLLIVIISLSGLLNTKTRFSLVIPTPFFKRPFEFTVGFRNTFYLFIVSYFLTGIALFVDNFNLGIFALALVYLTTWSYYLKPEKDYYVWIYSFSPLQFLFQKMKIAWLYSSLLSLPIILFLGAFYPENAGILLVCFLLGYAFLILMISAKYSVYPEEINIPQAILIVLCFSCPPLLLAAIPFFITRSVSQLNYILK